jgi:hypothetical protein
VARFASPSSQVDELEEGLPLAAHLRRLAQLYDIAGMGQALEETQPADLAD